MTLLSRSTARVRTSGRFFRLGGQKWHVKGLCYGPFAPNDDGEFLPDEERLLEDFAQMRRLGATAIRVYHPPPIGLLDAALESDLRVLIDVPWEKHRCFFEDWTAQQDARSAVRRVAREVGNHPAVFAVSVVNEFPNDVVRFSGQRRLEKFVDELLDIVRQEAPECLATFANFPTTEFLEAGNQDFACFNVYLHDPAVLGTYLDRLQHVAGAKPLVLGEYGIDSLRQGEPEQADLIDGHLEQVFRRGLAGSFVFSYTDDWYTGGCRIDDWAFGVTRADRSEKPAARRLRDVWSHAPHRLLADDLPSVSVVVCSYNGAATLEECLHSLMRLNYPDYEVILVDDGSVDETPRIAAQFPQVEYVRQPNRGLSAARNVGAERARGEIVAYTDSDCVADEDWLLYLVRGMLDQQVEAIGGPNLSPPSDNWTARCVAASPGNPSHVMLDDRRAEHVPGCNMAIRREVLLAIGGFDPQYRQAGDDVDVCWRLLDAGLSIGYAPGAMVWHHRRCTVRAFFRQQTGYGRAEAMVQFKHPQRYGSLGRPRFSGVIYGDGAVGLPVLRPRIYHGRFGSAPFQTIYRSSEYGLRAWLTSFEWHAVALFFLVLATISLPMGVVSLLMWSGSLLAAGRSAWQAPLPKDAPLWCRPLVFWLHLAQPIVRGWHRCAYRLGRKRLPRNDTDDAFATHPVKQISAIECDLYWPNDEGRGREHLLEALVEEARRQGWHGDFDGGWVPWDVELLCDRWHSITVRTATEELGWPRRFTRARWSVQPTDFSRALVGSLVVWSALATATGTAWAVVGGLAASSAVLASLILSRRRCLKAVGRLLWRAAERGELVPPVRVEEPVRDESVREPVAAVVEI